MDEHSTPPSPEDFLRHAEHLRALARRLVRDDAEADDLVQEAWLSVLERKEAPAPERGWRAWFAGTLRNLAREKRRAEGRRARRERGAARDEAIASEDVVERLETFQILARELAALDEPYRSTLYQRFFEHSSNAEIAEREGVVEATVRSRHMRGLEMLRERLDRRWHGDRPAWILLLEEIGRRDRPSTAAGSKVLLAAIAIVLVAAGSLIFVALHGAGTSIEVARATGTDAGVDPAKPADAAAPSSSPATESPAAAAAAPLEGALATRKARPVLRLIDERTSEPLPDYGIVVWRRPTDRLALLSDDRGVVVCPNEFEEGLLTIELVDEPHLAESRRAAQGRRAFPWTIPVEFRPGAGPIEVRAAVGPTFRLDLRRADDASPLALEGGRAELLASDPGGLQASTTALLRKPRDPTDLPWVRFLDAAGALSGPPPFTLRVDVAPGWHGEARVADLAGAHQEPIVVELAPGADLTVNAWKKEAGGATLEGTVVELALDGRVRERSGTATGSSFRGLAPGTWRVRVRRAGCSDEERDVELAPFAQTSVDFVLRPVAGARDLRGRIETDGGPLPLDARVTLRDPETGLEIATAAEARDGHLVFAFDALPPRACELCVQASNVWRWREDGLVVHPPAGEVVFLALTAAPVRKALKFRAFEESTGERIDRFAVEICADPPRGTPLRQTATFGNTQFDRVPLDAHLAWTVMAEGFVPARGDARAIEPEDDHEVVRVNLVHGWQRDVVVRDARTAKALEGVRVLVDGSEAGRTDASGSLRITRANAPRAIGVQLDGWRIAGGGLDPERGRYTSEAALRIVVQLEKSP